MTIDSKQESREHPRYSISPMCFIVRRGSTEKVDVIDASYRGLLLVAKEPPAMRSLLKLRLVLPSGELFVHAVVMRIVRRSPNTVHIGVRFFLMSGDARLAWETFMSVVSKRLPEAA